MNRINFDKTSHAPQPFLYFKKASIAAIASTVTSFFWSKQKQAAAAPEDPPLPQRMDSSSSPATANPGRRSLYRELVTLQLPPSIPDAPATPATSPAANPRKRKLTEEEEADPSPAPLKTGKNEEIGDETGIEGKRKRLQQMPHAVTLAPQLEIDLESAPEARLDYILELANLVDFLRQKSPSLPPENVYVGRTMTGLARSLQIDANGDIWILLNRQDQGDKVLGKGTFKRVSRAIRLKTLEVFARAVYPDSSEVERDVYLAEHSQEGVEGLARPVSFIRSYENKKGEEKAAIILPEYNPHSLYEELVNEKLSPVESWQIAVDVLNGLKNLDSMGLCHLDIKPENIFLDKQGNKRAVLGDFNLAGKKGVLSRWAGTRDYMSPEMEQAKAIDSNIEASPAMDIYSMGKVFHHLIGRSPAGRKLVQKMTDPDPKKRPSVGEMLQACRGFLDAAKSASS